MPKKLKKVILLAVKGIFLGVGANTLAHTDSSSVLTEGARELLMLVENQRTATEMRLYPPKRNWTWNALRERCAGMCSAHGYTGKAWSRCWGSCLGISLHTCLY